MSLSVRLVERVVGNAGLRVDRAAGVIRGVRVLGLKSANGRSYTREAVARAAGLYEGVSVNVDHPARAGEQVGVDRRFGWLENVRQDADGGLRADLHYLKSHPLAERVVEAAERRPSLFGLSHNANGRQRGGYGPPVIEGIDRVYSVDLVADPASVAGLHEGRVATAGRAAPAAAPGGFNDDDGRHARRLRLHRAAERLRLFAPEDARALLEAAEHTMTGDAGEASSGIQTAPDDPQSRALRALKAKLNRILDSRESIEEVVRQLQELLKSDVEALARDFDRRAGGGMATYRGPSGPTYTTGRGGKS